MAKRKPKAASETEAATGPKFPDVKVQLSGEDGNAFLIIGRCLKAARKAGVPQADVDAFQKEATSGNYDHLLQTCMKYFDVC